MKDMPNTNNAALKGILSNKFSNRVTIALWVIALSSHALLLPKLLRDLSDRKRQGLM